MSNGDQLSSPSFSIYSVTISVFRVFPFRMDIYYNLCVSTHVVGIMAHALCIAHFYVLPTP